MLKQLMLVLLIFIFSAGGLYAMQEDQTCTVIKGAKVIQILPNKSLRAVTVPEEVSATIGAELTPGMANNLNNQTDLDWTGAHLSIIGVDFGQGPIPLLIVVKVGDVKDCK